MPARVLLEHLVVMGVTVRDAKLRYDNIGICSRERQKARPHPLPGDAGLPARSSERDQYREIVSVSFSLMA